MPPGPPVVPRDFVVFGGTGDLAVRKLLPALYLRDRDGQLPAETRIVALSRAGLDDAGYRDKIRGELPRFVARRRARRTVVDRFVARLTHVSIDIEHEAGWPALVETLDRPRPGPGVLPRHRARAVRPGQPRLAEHGLVDRELPARPGEADRPRPRLGPGDQRRGRRGVRGAPDLPDRPLPRQGERAEPAGDPLRQHASSSRCGTPTASTTCRSPPPSRSASAAAAATTTAPAPCATWSRTTCCSCSAWWRWSPRRTSAARPSATRSSRCSRRCKPIDRRATSTAPSSPGQYCPGLVDGERRARRTRPTRSDPARPPRPSWRSRPRCRTGAGPACRSTCAPASGWTAACSEIVIQFKAVPHPMFPGSEGTNEPNRLVIQLQPDEGMRLHLTAKEPGPGGIRLRPVSLDLSYAQTFQRQLPRRLRAAADGRRAGQPDPVHAPRRGRGRLDVGRADPRRAGRVPATPPPLPRRHQRPQRRRSPFSSATAAPGTR